MAVGVILALDVGDVRIGVAVSRSGMIAEPLTVLERSGRTQTLDAIEALVNAHGASQLVLGLPLLEGGAEGEQAEKTRAFARSLRRRLPKIPIVFQDERFSSEDARDLRPGTRGPIDHLAAAVILRDYLNARNDAGTGATRS